MARCKVTDHVKHGNIERCNCARQVRKNDSTAFAARLDDRARVKAEAAAAEASGKSVEFVFVERGAPRLQRGHWESLRNDSKVALCG